MASLSENLDFPGVAPARQKRSREMTAALLLAGAGMLRTRSLAELSIEALCGQIGATVGAFYSRFESKDAYFNALIELAARDGERGLSRIASSERVADSDLAGLCQLLVGGVIGWARKHEGVLRAALQHGDTRPDRWSTFKGLARATTAQATPPLLRVMGKGRKAPRHRLRLSNGAGHAGQRHPQRSRPAVAARPRDRAASERMPAAGSASGDEEVRDYLKNRH
jgi:AcrR family transcriptional regulator